MVRVAVGSGSYPVGVDDRRFPWLRTNPALTNMAPSDVPPAPAPAPPPPLTPAHRSRAWWLMVPALVVLACTCGGVVSMVGGGDQAETAPAVPAPPIVAEATPGVSPVPQEVVYLVTSTGRGEKISVEYTDEDHDIIRKGEVPLPWRHTFRTGGDQPPLVLLAQRRTSGTGPLTCTITVDGKTLTTNAQDGRSAAVMCSA